MACFDFSWRVLPPPLAASLALLTSGAQAQTPACDQLKATLAARIDPSIRGFTLETATANASLPPGAKVIGTCEGNVYKILLRRGGDLRPSYGAASAAASTPAAAKAAVPTSTPAPTTTLPPVKAPVEAPRAAAMLSPLVPADRALRALPAAPTRSPAAPPARQAVLASAVAAPPPARESARAGDAALLRTAERSTQPPSPLSLDTPPEAPSARGLAPPRLMGGLWPWVVALLLLPLAAWGWAWFSHRRAFDAAGLPRGPRLKP